MKSKILFLIILSYFFSQCSSIPKIHEDQSLLNTIIFKKCHNAFLKNPETRIHSIQATMGNRKATPFIGITTANPETRKIHSALMSIEGLVLFEAVNDKKLTINRAVGPFNSKSFAIRLIDDINSIFFKPEGKLIKTGLLKDGSMICRYKKNEIITDIIYDDSTKWTINVYTKKSIKKKIEILTQGTEKEHGWIKLKSYGRNKYNLDMKLIRTEKSKN